MLPAITGLIDTAEAEDPDLAKASQNPVSDLISLPFQNNTNFDVGPFDRTQNILNIQPVYPFNVGKWNLINRTIAPLIYQPIGENDDEFGLGDINHTTFLSPAAPGKVIWGAGPVLSFPTATDDVLGTEKWSAGPSVVALTMPGRWVLGGLVSNLWSFAGDSDRAHVNQMLLQHFVNYNFDKGWYLTSAPILTANWKVDSDNRWTVPFGIGVGKIFRIGKQPINRSLQFYYNVEKPDTTGADWAFRFQVQFLFPK
ncbi:neuromedin U [bacterium]|nr:neuromedin U [bacterium]